MYNDYVSGLGRKFADACVYFLSHRHSASVVKIIIINLVRLLKLPLNN